MVDGPGATLSIDVGRKSARTTDQRDRWALVLGASSGFGAATALALAREGYGIIGVHLDPLSRIATAQAVRQQIAATGVPVHFPNLNAANAMKRARVVADIQELFDARRASGCDGALDTRGMRSSSSTPASTIPPVA